MPPSACWEMLPILLIVNTMIAPTAIAPSTAANLMDGLLRGPLLDMLLMDSRSMLLHRCSPMISWITVMASSLTIPLRAIIHMLTT